MRAAKEAQDKIRHKQLDNKRKALINSLSKQAVKKMRAEYFNRVDRLRALGQSTFEEAASTTTTIASRVAHGGRYYGRRAFKRIAQYV
jgi:hypothetical protein